MLLLAACLTGCGEPVASPTAKTSDALGPSAADSDSAVADAAILLADADTAGMADLVDAAAPADAPSADALSPDATAEGLVDAATADTATADTATADTATAETATGTGDATAADADATGPLDSAGSVTPTYPPATFGGDFLVDLGGSSADGATIQTWTLPGQPATLIFGPQGGYHLWVSVCGPEMLGSKASLKIQATLPDGTQIDPGMTELTTKLVAVAGKSGQLCRVAAPAFVTCACELHGVPLRIRVDVTDLSAGPGSIAVKQAWAAKTVVPKHDLGPCWAKGSPPCAGRRGPK